MTRAYPELFILRHGQTVWNAAGRMQGSLDSPLTALGRVQASTQRNILDRAQIEADHEVFCSPLGRTRETAALALRGRDGPVVLDERLKEISVGDLEGLTMVDIEAEWPEVLESRMPFRWHFHTPGGESFESMCDRLQGWLDERTRPTIAVTHGITSRVLRGLVLGLDIDGMQNLQGGQGVVHHVKDGVHRQLEA